MASIRDVANLAGVSTATVSHVINGTRYVSPELTERVQAILLELSYQPDAVARSLRRRETLTIGLLVPNLQIPFFAAVAYSIERAAAGHGYSIILCNSEWQQEKESLQLQDLLARRVDGLICISASMNAADIAPFIDAGTPVVMFERQMPGIGLDAVGIDNIKGAYRATEHLLDLGHSRVAVITGKTISTVSERRLQGYRQALEHYGLAYDPGYVFHGDYLPESGNQAVKYFLSLPDRPTAIFAFNDLMALGALQALYKRGVLVPDHVAVMGFDGIVTSQYTSPALTTVRQPLTRMGQTAVSLLMERIRGEGPEQAQYIELEPELIIRASTAHEPSAKTSTPSEQLLHA